MTKSPVHRGEHEGNRNTIVQGMPGCLGEPVVTTLVCFFYFAYEAAGAVERPAFPAPSLWRDTNFRITRAPLAPRECGRVSRIEMSKQTYSSCPDLIRASIELRKGVFEEGWMAGSSPAMTEEEGSNVQRRPGRRRYAVLWWNHCSPLPLIGTMRTCLYRKGG